MSLAATVCAAGADARAERTRRCPDCGAAYTIAPGRGRVAQRCPACRAQRKRAQGRAYMRNRPAATRWRDRRRAAARRRARREQINRRRRRRRRRLRPRCAACGRRYRAYRPTRRWPDRCKPCRKTAAARLARELAGRLGHAPARSDWDRHVQTPASKVIYDWFGSWAALRDAAGLSHSPRPGRPAGAGESVYVLAEQPLHPGERTYIKIGRATDPHSRLRAYRTHNPRPTRILREIPCGTDARATETAIHQLLHAHRLRGEWFTHHAADQLDQLTDHQIRALAHQPA